MRKIMIFLIVLSFIIMPVKAEECSYKDKSDAMKEAANVKVDYEIVEDKQYEEGFTAVNEYFKVTILNVTEDLYIDVTNDVTSESKTYTYADATDGVITFNWENNENVTNFVFKIYANVTPCYGTELRTVRKQTPRYNDFYNRAICAEDDMKDFYLCQKYTNLKEIDESMFIDKVDGFMNGKVDEEGKEIEKPKTESKIESFLEKNKFVLIGILAGVVVIGTTIVIIKKKRNRGKMAK